MQVVCVGIYFLCGGDWNINDLYFIFVFGIVVSVYNGVDNIFDFYGFVNSIFFFKEVLFYNFIDDGYFVDFFQVLFVDVVASIDQGVFQVVVIGVDCLGGKGEFFVFVDCYLIVGKVVMFGQVFDIVKLFVQYVVVFVGEFNVLAFGQFLVGYRGGVILNLYVVDSIVVEFIFYIVLQAIFCIEQYDQYKNVLKYFEGSKYGLQWMLLNGIEYFYLFIGINYGLGYLVQWLQGFCWI